MEQVTAPSEEVSEKPPRDADSTNVNGTGEQLSIPIRGSSTETLARYTFEETDLVDLLVKFEHLVEEEAMARAEKVWHEPAVPFLSVCACV